MGRLHRISIGILTAILCCQGCATLKTHSFVIHSHRPSEDVRFYQALDGAIIKAKVHDDADFPVAGFPYLRANGYFVGLKKQLDSEARNVLWVRQLQQLDLADRKKEIQNLPESRVADLCRKFALPLTRVALIQKLDDVSQEMLEYDQRQYQFYETLKTAVNFRSEYSEVMRVVGLYPLVSLAVRYATYLTYDEFRNWHKTPEDKLKVRGKVTAYAAQQQMAFPSDKIKKLFTQRDVFDAVKLSENATQELALALAPVIEPDVVADYDKIGEVVWDHNHVRIDTQKPTVYYYISYSFIKGKPVLQFNYVFWFSKRAGAAPRLEYGPLDGSTVRITLDEKGLPMIMDTTNNCGCYFFFVPRQDKLEKVIKKRWGPNLLQPAWLPQDYPEQHLKIRLVSGWHQIENISTGSTPSDAIPYQLLPYDILENLPRPDGSTDSVFDSIGIMKNSYRSEPRIFFPMGIYKVGYMRQRGHHAIKLVGKEHFSAPELYDSNFIFK